MLQADWQDFEGRMEDLGKALLSKKPSLKDFQGLHMAWVCPQRIHVLESWSLV